MFTNCGATGAAGPQNCYSAYTQPWTADSSFFSITGNGTQQWTVPQTGEAAVSRLCLLGQYCKIHDVALRSVWQRCQVPTRLWSKVPLEEAAAGVQVCLSTTRPIILPCSHRLRAGANPHLKAHWPHQSRLTCHTDTAPHKDSINSRKVNRWLCGRAESAGLGGIVDGTVGLQAGQTLLIVVGQAGPYSSTPYAGGGGGATFVLTADQSLLVAGGGGGGSCTTCNPGVFLLQTICGWGKRPQNLIFMVASVRS